MTPSNLSRDIEKRKWNWKKWWSTFVFVLLSGCLVAAVLLIWQLRDYEPFTATSYQPNPTDAYVVAAIEGNANITLPSSARDIYDYTTGFQDIFITVRFSMNADELDEFMKTTLCQEALKQIDPEQQPISEENPDWWTPNQAEHLQGCNGNDDHTHQTVLIDMTDPNTYIVFVSTSTF